MVWMFLGGLVCGIVFSFGLLTVLAMVLRRRARMLEDSEDAEG